jgi:hypothetical protein
VKVDSGDYEFTGPGLRSPKCEGETAMRIRESDVANKLMEIAEIEYANHVSDFARVHRDMYEAMGPSPDGAFIGSWGSQNAIHYEHGYDL